MVGENDSGGLTGGVGLYNNGGTVEFLVRADRFRVVRSNPFGTGELVTTTNSAVPFEIRNGVVYINEAAFQDASIVSAKIASLAADKVTGLQAIFDTLTVNLANVTGTLQAGHVDSDVPNIKRLRGSRTISGSSWTACTLSETMGNFDFLMVYVNPVDGGADNSTMPCSLRVSRLSTSAPSLNFDSLYLSYQIGAADGQGCQGHAYRSTSGTTLYLRRFSNEEFNVDAIYGLKL